MAFDWSGILNGVSNTATGGLFGLIGTAISGVSGYFQRKQELEVSKENNRHLETVAQLEMETRKYEADSRVQVSTIEADVQIAQADANLRTASYANDQKLSTGKPKYGWIEAIFGVVDAFQRLIRPVLTIMLCLFTYFIYSKMVDLLGGVQNALDAHDAVMLIARVVDMILFLTATALTWWFGARTVNPPSSWRGDKKK